MFDEQHFSRVSIKKTHHQASCVQRQWNSMNKFSSFSGSFPTPLFCFSTEYFNRWIFSSVSFIIMVNLTPPTTTERVCSWRRFTRHSLCVQSGFSMKSVNWTWAHIVYVKWRMKWPAWGFSVNFSSTVEPLTITIICCDQENWWKKTYWTKLKDWFCSRQKLNKDGEFDRKINSPFFSLSFFVNKIESFHFDTLICDTAGRRWERAGWMNENRKKNWKEQANVCGMRVFNIFWRVYSLLED